MRPIYKAIFRTPYDCTVGIFSSEEEAESYILERTQVYFIKHNTSSRSITRSLNSINTSILKKEVTAEQFTNLFS